jgi:hypothetical protein
MNFCGLLFIYDKCEMDMEVIIGVSLYRKQFPDLMNLLLDNRRSVNERRRTFLSFQDHEKYRKFGISNYHG